MGEAADASVGVRAQSAPPAVTGASRVGAGTVTLQAVPPTGLTAAWYNDSVTSTILSRSNSFTTPSLSATRKYWAQSLANTNQHGGLAARGSLTGAGINNNTLGQCFTVVAPIVLDSVMIYTGTSGTLNVTIRSLASNAVVFSKAITVTTSPTLGTKISLGAQLQPGAYLMTPEGSAGISSLWRTRTDPTSLPYPYNVAGVLHIDSASAAGSAYVAWYYFYDWKVRPLLCASARVPVTATIDATTCTPPAAPAAQPPAAVCAGVTVNLAASGAPAGYGYRWYDTPAGTVNLPSGQSASFSLAAVRTDTFYVAVQSLTDPNCFSTRTRVIVLVSPVPNAPTGSADSACSGASVTLRAAGGTGGQVYTWYAQPLGGGGLNTGSAYTWIPSVARDTLYVSLKNAAAPGCESERHPVVYKVRRTPAVPLSASQQRCGSGSVTLTATTLAGDTAVWYNIAGQAVRHGSSFTTPSLTATTQYRVLAKSSGSCMGNAMTVSATINAIPARPALSRSGANLQSSNTCRHVWLLNRAPTADTGNSIANPPNGTWRAITVSQGCRSDTSLPFIVTSLGERTNPAPRLYPNPAEDRITLENCQGFMLYELHDLLGRALQQGAVAQTLPVHDLPRGVYFLKLTGAGRHATVLRFEKK